METTRLKVTGYQALSHLLLEVVCYSMLIASSEKGEAILPIALLYDALAFVPQGLIGLWTCHHSQRPLGWLGCGLLAVGVVVFPFQPLVGIVLAALANSILHIAGALATIANSSGKLLNPAIFVAAGSLGVFIGQTYWLSFVGQIVIVGLIGLCWRITLKMNCPSQQSVPPVDLVKQKYGYAMVVSVSFMTVVMRSYVSYCIPTAWKQGMIPTFCLFFAYALGKALGGYLIDLGQSKLVSILSTFVSLPFLLAGKEVMWLSLIGIVLYSMSMALTLGLFLSVMPEKPGVAFGFTTLGLFVGSLPVFLWGSFSNAMGGMMLVGLSVFSGIGLFKILR